jgi:hypothetical protein
VKLFLRIFGLLGHYTRMKHISDHDLERYHLGMVLDDAELAPLEEHVLACPECAEQAEDCASYVDTLRAAILAGNFDLDSPPLKDYGGQKLPRPKLSD